MWRVLRHALGNGGFCGTSAAASPSSAAPASILLRAGGGPGRGRSRRDRSGDGGSSTGGGGGNYTSAAFFATGATTVTTATAATTAGLAAACCDAPCGCDSPSSSPPSPASGSEAVRKSGDGGDQRVSKRPSERHPPPTFRRRKLSVVMPPAHVDDAAMAPAEAEDFCAATAAETSSEETEAGAGAAAGLMRDDTIEDVKRRRRRRMRRETAKTRSADAVECVDVPPSSESSSSSTQSEEEQHHASGFGEVISEAARFFTSSNGNSSAKHHQSSAEGDTHADLALGGDDADAELSLPFPSSQCAVLSAHGIEPHPYLLRPPAPLLFGHAPPPKLITVVTRKINQDRGRVCHPYGGPEDDDDGDGVAADVDVGDDHEEDDDLAEVALDDDQNSDPNRNTSADADAAQRERQHSRRLARRTALFAVYDGHGERGEAVAEFAMKEVPKRLREHPEFMRGRGEHDGKVGGDDDDDRKGGRIEMAFRDALRAIDGEVKLRWEMRPENSGSTACVVLLRGSEIHAANVGDSRAVLGRRRWTPGHRRRRRRRHDEESSAGGQREEQEGDNSHSAHVPSSSSPYDIFRSSSTSKHNKDDHQHHNQQQQQHEYTALDLTTDQSPSAPAERDRIHRHGGYVSPSGGPGNPSRVWADHNFSMVGLAMSRSLGDFNVKDLGVICDPVVTRYGVVTAGDLEREEEEAARMEDNRGDEGGEKAPGEGATSTAAAKWVDDFLIVASDGVWEFLTSEEAVKIVGKVLNDNGGNARKACAELIRTAVALWKENEGDYRDDVTAVVVRLDGLWDSSGDDENDEHEDEKADRDEQGLNGKVDANS